jgi:hypothetical protein
VKELENEKLFQFQKRKDHWCAFNWSIRGKNCHIIGVLRATDSKVMSA